MVYHFFGRSVKVFASDCQNRFILLCKIFAPGQTTKSELVHDQMSIKMPLFWFYRISNEDSKSAIAACIG